MIFREPKNKFLTIIHAIIFAIILSFVINLGFIEGACSGKTSKTCVTLTDVGKCSNDYKSKCSNQIIGTGSDYGWVPIQ
jgi:hypothetical protein